MDADARARVELERVNALVAKLDSDMVKARDEKRKLEAFLEVSQRFSNQSNIEPAHAKKIEPRSGSKSSQLVKASIEAIRQAGRPLSIIDLLQFIEQSGLVVGGARSAPNLAGFLSRSDKIFYERGIGWSEARQAPQTNEAAGPVQSREPAASAQPASQGDAGGGG